MPYIFIWGSYTLKGLNFTRITNGTLEKYWGTRKGGISKHYPSMYVSKTTELMIGQCTRSKVTHTNKRNHVQLDEAVNHLDEQNASEALKKEQFLRSL